MKDKIKILCPGIQVGDDEVRQIVKPGIINSDKCEFVQSSFFNRRVIEDQKFADKFKQDGGYWYGPPTMEYQQPKLGTFTEHLPDDRLAEPLWIPYEEDDIDVLLIHGSGHPDGFRSLANYYKHLPVINVDYKDVPPDRMYCEILNRDNVYNFKRNMVKEDIVNKQKNVITRSVRVGKYPYKVHHAAFCVREDILEQQNKLMRPYCNRSYDVSCFFPIRKETKHILDYPMGNFDCIRGWIGGVVDICREKLNLNVHVGYTNSTNDSPQAEGRQGTDIDKPGSLQYNYCDTMTNSKIIVTSCPSPGWEGDYRLMEAMTSKALVMHNRMIIPPDGLVDGVHWILFDDPVDLQNKIEYYTQHPGEAAEIAITGRKYVLENHRPHHRVEQWLRVAGLL